MTSSVALNNAWSNANVLGLQSTTTIFPGGPLTDSQIGQLFALLMVGALFGNVTSLWIVEKYGRKPTIIATVLPQLLGNLLIVFARDVDWLYVARILVGFANGLAFVCEPLFTAEICSDSVRGALNSLAFIIFNMSYVLGLTMSIFLDYRQQALYSMFVPTLLLLLMVSFVHETPEFLYRQKAYEEGENSWAFYRGKNVDEAKHSLILRCSNLKPTPALSLRDFFGTRAARRSILIVLVLSCGTHYSGFGILAYNSTSIFDKMGSFLTPIQSSIAIAIVQFCASSFNIFLIDRFGRRSLLILSSGGGACGMTILSIHHFFKTELPITNWIPVCGVILTIFFLSFGVSIVPFIMTIDILPTQIRAPVLTIMQLLFWTNAFILDTLYFNLVSIIKLHGCFMMFADFCLLFLLFVLVYVPETKGKSYESVQRLFEK